MLPTYTWRIVVKRGEFERIRNEGKVKLRWGMKLGGNYTTEKEAYRQFDELKEMGFSCKLYRTPCTWELLEE